MYVMLDITINISEDILQKPFVQKKLSYFSQQQFRLRRTAFNPFFFPKLMTHLSLQTHKLQQLYKPQIKETAIAATWVQWSSWQSIGLVTKRLRVRLTPGALQVTLSKLLTYCVLRPTQPPTLSGTGNEQQLRPRGKGLVWLIGAIVCLLAAPWVQMSVSVKMDGHIMCCGTIGSCQSAATTKILKRCWSRV